MDVHFSEKVKQYCINKNISQLVLDVDYLEEPCTQIYTPIVRTVKKTDELDKFASLGTFEGVDVYQAAQFNEVFNSSAEFNFELKGLLKKHVAVTNVDPIIKNVCKMPGA